MHRPPKPVLIFDGDCRFCRIWIDYWRLLTGGDVEYTAFQEGLGRFPQVKEDDARQAVQLVLPDGRVLWGAEAVFHTLRGVPGGGWPYRAYRRVPGVAAVTEALYRLVARHREPAYRVTRWCWGDRIRPPAYVVSRWLFLRVLGFVYFVAFLSLLPQLAGLIGDNGILPAAEYLEQVEQNVPGLSRYWFFPTLAWIEPGSTYLQVLCVLGVVCGVLIVSGYATLPALVTGWVLYLSLLTAGQEFLAFQWDILLLETGFLAVFLAPRTLKPALTEEAPPPVLVIWLSRLLLFRLMFSSGMVKLLSGDPAWRSLTALQYHYQTQPLPTPLAWFAHQLPDWFQVASVAVMFVIELAVPILFFAPRRLRFAGATVTIVFQLLIAVTGNYTFFNLVAIALCLMLFDDAFWGPRLRPTSWGALQEKGREAWRYQAGWVRSVAAVLLVFLGGIQLGGLVFGGLPSPLLAAYRLFSPLRIVNGYGLFAVMTTTRPEIVIEGSDDAETWRAYVFEYKPQDLEEAPHWVAPYQPRLDWQMWFAALRDVRANPWFVRFCIRLAEGRPEVLGLLRENPFPDAPPRYLRASLYEYRFTELGADSSPEYEDGTWWRRRYLGPYLPAFSLGPE